MSAPFAHASARHAVALRTAIFVSCAVSAFQLPLSRLAEFPYSEAKPTGLLLLLPDSVCAQLFSSESALGTLPLVTCGLALLAATGLGFRFVAPLACLGVTLVFSINLSFSNVTHSKIGILLAAFTLAAFAWADRAATAPRNSSAINESPHLPPSAQALIQIRLLGIAVVLVTSYAFIGAHRLSDGGLDIFLSHPVPAWGYQLSFNPSSSWLFSVPLVHFLISNPVSSALLGGGFAVVTCFETLSPLVLVSRRFRIAWLVVIVGFHLISAIVLNLWFWENLVLIAFIVPWIDSSPGPT